MIHVFDALAVQVIYYYDWQHLHWLAIGLLLLVILIAGIMMRPFRPMPKMPLYGIDWLGMILWSIFILSLIFVAQIRLSTRLAAFSLYTGGIGMRLYFVGVQYRADDLHPPPFLEAAAFRVNNLTVLLIAFLFLGILLASKNTLQNTFYGSRAALGRF